MFTTVNDAYIADGVLDVQRPEVLVYEPYEGRVPLVAVILMEHAQQWDAANTAPPVFGSRTY